MRVRRREGRAAPEVERRWWRVGLVGVALLVLGAGWSQAFDLPPYHLVDEQAHVGYVLELQDGRLPTIDSPIDEAEGGPLLRKRLVLSLPSQRDVWVANNPPLAYAAAVVPAGIARVLDLPGGPLLGVRLTNLAFFVAATVLVARLGRRLAGGDPTVGLLAAAAFASVPHVGTVAGAAFVDGLALLCTVAILDLLVAVCRAGPTRRQVVALALWCAVAVGVRPMTAMVAGVAAAAVVGFALVRDRRERAAGGGEEDADAAPEGPDQPARARPAWAALVLGVPAAVVGTYYVRNLRLYGDPTGSEHLIEKFGRAVAGRSLPDVLQTWLWARPLEVLLLRRLPDEEPIPPAWLLELVAGLLGLAALAAVVVVVRDRREARRDGTEAHTPGAGWLAAGLVSAVVVALTAQHWVDGGAIHPRYLLLPLVVLAVAVVLALVRLRARWAAVALVAGLVALQVPLRDRFPHRAAGRPRGALYEPTGSESLRELGVAALVVGLVVVVAAAAGLRRWRRDAGVAPA